MSDSLPRGNRLFLSYAHDDDEPIITGGPGWVASFQHSLAVRLKQLLGSEPTIFWDRKSVRGNDLLGAVIDTDLVRCSILIPVVSPSYVNFERSEWCRRELETFCAAAERVGGVRIGERSRIFKVMKTPVPLERQPNPLRDLLGYEFYRTDPRSGRVREFWLQPRNVEPEYIEKVDDLSHDIKDFLESIEEAASPDRHPPPRDERPTVYLAEATADLAAEREQVVRALKQRGCRILPDRPLPVVAGTSLRKYVAACIDSAALSIHLVGANYGVIPEGESESVVVIQNQLASRRSAERGFARLLWIAPGLEAADPRQAAFLDQLRTDSDAQHGAEILHCSLEELDTLIQDALERTARRAPPRHADTANAEVLKYVYLVCDRRDLEAAQALRDVLYECEPNVEVSLPLFEGDEGDIRDVHREQLRSCDGVLLYFGSATVPWLEMKRMELRRMDGLGRARPVLCKAIYFGPPPSPAKERFHTREALVLHGPGGPSRSTLQAFLERLEPRRGS